MAGVGKRVKLETPFSTFPLFNAGQRGTAPLPRPQKLESEGGCSGEKAQEKKKVPHSVTGAEGRMGYQAVL
jgi:hypothetical protein